MKFIMMNGEQYTIPINLENLNDYNSFNNYVLEYLSNINLKEKLDNPDSYIKYIYEDTIIDSDNYISFINTNTDNITLGIVLQNLPKK